MSRSAAPLQSSLPLHSKLARVCLSIYPSIYSSIYNMHNYYIYYLFRHMEICYIYRERFAIHVCFYLFINIYMII